MVVVNKIGAAELARFAIAANLACEYAIAETLVLGQNRRVLPFPSVTSSLATERKTVPRRRFQRGRLTQRGKTPMWVGMYREDRLQPTFKRIRRTVTLGPCSSMSQRSALAAFQPYLDVVNTAPAPTVMRKGTTFAEAVREWREQIAVNLKPSTVRAAESHLSQHIEPRLGGFLLRDMTVKNLQAFVTSTAATGVTRKTLENILQTVFSILRTARMFGNSLPVVKRSDLMLPRDEAQKEVRFLSAKEVGQIINNAKEPYATMFAVLGMTGCRVGEMLGLKIGDLDFNRKLIYIRRSIDSRTKMEQSTKTKNSTGEVPMPEALERRLRAFLTTGRRDNPNGYLFANRNGNPYSVGKVTEYGLWPVQDKLGISHTGTHAFRHAAASELLEEGAPLSVVQRQLRHGDAKTTLQKYGHVVGDSQRRAINNLAEKIERQAIELESSVELESSAA
jgi:integrase